MGMLKATIMKNLHGASQEIEMNISLNIKFGEFIGLYGTSGSGKTTLLRILAGLENSNSSITFNDDIWQDTSTFKDVNKRDISFVFQDYALFPNMSVEQNILFANDDIELCNVLLNITQLSRLKDTMPSNLSGGQKQRVALCRAIISKPKLLLLDEPFSALNDDLKYSLYKELKELHKQFNFTTILVSHNKMEIYKLCDNMYHIHNGKIINYDRPSNIFLENDIQSLQSIVVEKLVDNHIIITIFNKFFTVQISENRYNNINVGETLEFNINE